MTRKFWSTAILAVGPAGILPAGSRLAGETPASPGLGGLEACAPPHLDNVWQN